MGACFCCALSKEIIMSEVKTSQDINPVYSLDASRDYFLDPNSYTRFDLTDDFRIPIACAEPRNEIREKKILTAIQGAGGGAGEAQDRAVEDTILNNFDTVSTYEAFLRETTERGTSVLGGHPRCKFLLANTVVLKEEAESSDFTLDNFHRSLRRYEIGADILPLMPAINNAVKGQLEFVNSVGDLDDMVPLIDRVYSDHANVAHVHGDNQAEIYIENHHPHVGLNRDKKAKQRDLGIDIQGYHESRLAGYEELVRHNRERGVTKLATAYRVGAFFLRSAASRTVLGSLRPNTEFYDLEQDNYGLKITQQEGLN
jgi:hypothetical protein